MFPLPKKLLPPRGGQKRSKPSWKQTSTSRVLPSAGAPQTLASGAQSTRLSRRGTLHRGQAGIEMRVLSRIVGRAWSNAPACRAGFPRFKSETILQSANANICTSSRVGPRLSPMNRRLVARWPNRWSRCVRPSPILSSKKNHGPLAQTEERPTHNRVVAVSKSARPTTTIIALPNWRNC